MGVRRVQCEREQDAVIRPLSGLMKIENRLFQAAPLERVAEAKIELLS